MEKKFKSFINKDKMFEIRFDENIQTYTNKDGYIAIGLYLYNIILITITTIFSLQKQLFFYFSPYFKSIELVRLVAYLPIPLLQLIPLFILLKYKKQSVRSVGLKPEKIFKQIIIGVLFSIPFMLIIMFFSRLHGRRLVYNNHLIWIFIRQFIAVALVEEVIFRGYIQTRIQGLIKGKWKSIIIVALMFSFAHISSRMIRDNIGFFKYISSNIAYLKNLCIFHVYFVYLYTRNNNVISSTVFHGLNNFIIYSYAYAPLI
ncbi:hypothetical protein GCM10008905_10100 [Clostridium malenominatum]|uniref:CAAX prenyl protease 2/Lysostaphin resistance protein A-like domain-containing protein n=1 Tax=Clostridium malenominatum TaxID=1539 RepID=A0ABP3TYE5_9CLOT